MSNSESPEARGRRDRFDALYREHYGRVLAYVLRRVPREVADDVVAETFLVAWRRLERVPGEPLPWLLAVARKTLATQHRSARRHGALLSELTASGLARGRADMGSADDARAIAVAQAVERLAERDQELLKLTVWDGLSTKEAAAVIGSSDVACRVRLHRAKRRLAAALAEAGDGGAARTSAPFRVKEEAQ
jgi:RNA polymerase sigma factor (sigma-70 family)